MTDEHTPGPWGIEHTRERFWIGPMREDGRKAADLVASLDAGGDACSAQYNRKQEANARLIAAAPELLEALERQAEAWSNALELGIIAEQHRTSATILRDEAHAAIAKARGQKDG